MVRPIVIAREAGASSIGGRGAGGLLRTGIVALLVLVLLVVAYRQGRSDASAEVSVLRAQVARLSKGGAALEDDGLAPTPAVTTTMKLRGRGKGKGKKPAPETLPAAAAGDESEATTVAPPPSTAAGGKNKKKRRTAAPATEAAAAGDDSASSAAGGDDKATAPAAAAGDNNDAGGAIDDDRSLDDGHGAEFVPGRRSPHSDDAGATEAVVSVQQSAEHPALITHTYHDAEAQRFVVAAVDRHFPKWTMSSKAKASPEDQAEIERHDWSRRVMASVTRAWQDPAAAEVVPTMVIPLFHDGNEVKALLSSVDAPVRLFAFSWNSNNPEIRDIVAVLKRIPFGVVINHFAENVGFSGAVNAGVKSARRFLPSATPAGWYFIVNADTEFPGGVLGKFASQVNALPHDEYALVYGPRQDHFAFVITRKAVDTVGYFDEVFWPGYMEDIDYHWRTRIAGLKKKITGAHFRHKQSTNERKPRSTTGDYGGMLHRASKGWEYGWMKWGRYTVPQIERDVPPSGWTTPFNVPNAPLSLWTLDAGQRRCVRTSKGQYHIKSSTCWYNGTKLLQKLPPGTELTRNLLVPGPTGR